MHAIAEQGRLPQKRTGQTVAFPQSVRPFMTVPLSIELQSASHHALPGVAK